MVLGAYDSVKKEVEDSLLKPCFSSYHQSSNVFSKKKKKELSSSEYCEPTISTLAQDRVAAHHRNLATNWRMKWLKNLIETQMHLPAFPCHSSQQPAYCLAAWIQIRPTVASWASGEPWCNALRGT